METFEAIRTLLAVRDYLPKPIPADVVHRILEAGRLTASARNRQPWRFIAVDDPALLKRLGELSSRGPYIAQAAVCIAVAIDGSGPATVDGARAVQSMMLAAWEQGIGSNWVSVVDEERPAMVEALGLPAEWRLLCFVPCGYPARRLGLGRKQRKPLTEIAFRNRFGRSL